jgi:peroxiredoxin-like protein
MQPLPHLYTVNLSAHAAGCGEVTSPGLPPLCLNAPADFDGPGDEWSPEHLLLTAVQGCFLLTFRAVAAASKFPFVALTAETRGTVDRTDGVTRFTEIVLKPTVTFPAGTNMERAARLVEKAERNCLISASLSTPVRLEPTLLEAT